MAEVEKRSSIRKDEKNKVEYISDLIGDYGKYQRLNSWAHGAAWGLLSPFLVLALPFYAPPVESYCADDPALYPNAVSSHLFIRVQV